MVQLSVLALLAAAVTGATAAAISPETARAASKFPIPDNDPFYQPPAGFASAKPGTIFKKRDALKPGLASATLAIQVLYRTNDANNKPSATVATILQGANPNKNQLVVYNNFEDAANTTCSPSYSFNTNPNSAFGPKTFSNLTDNLKKGWTIVIPDYEGFISAFSVGHLEGRAVLDSLRAALALPEAGLSKNTIIGGYGYSGGAIATGWAAALQPTYAPELKIVGWAFGGTPANVTSTLLKVDGTNYAGFGVGGLAGQIAAYPESQALYESIITPAGQKIIADVLSQCAISDLAQVAGKSLLKTTKYQTLGPALLTNPTVYSILQRGILGLVASETPKAPVYMYHGVPDQVIPYESALYAAQQWCSRGANLQFVSNKATGHAGTLTALQKVSQAWLDDRMNGIAAPSGCTFTNTTYAGLPL